MKLWLVRHAQPLIAPGLCYGRLDMAADADASAECAHRLALELPADTRVASSPLRRCAQLARQLQRLRPDLAYGTDARLQEMDFGRWEGRAWQDIAPAELQAWTDDFAHHTVGGTGQSVAAFMARVASAYDALAADGTPGSEPQPSSQVLTPGLQPESENKTAGVHPAGEDRRIPPAQGPHTSQRDNASATSSGGTRGHSAAKPAGNVLWITHAGVIRAASLLAQGLRHIERADQWPLDAPKYGQWRTLELHIDPVQAQKACAATG